MVSEFGRAKEKQLGNGEKVRDDCRERCPARLAHLLLWSLLRDNHIERCRHGPFGVLYRTWCENEESGSRARTLLRMSTSRTPGTTFAATGRCKHHCWSNFGWVSDRRLFEYGSDPMRTVRDNFWVNSECDSQWTQGDEADFGRA